MSPWLCPSLLKTVKMVPTTTATTTAETTTAAATTLTTSKQLRQRQHQRRQQRRQLTKMKKSRQQRVSFFVNARLSIWKKYNILFECIKNFHNLNN